MTLWKTSVPHYYLFILLLAASGISYAQTLDGSLSGDDYGSALSVQTVQTGFGDNGNELNAAYGYASVEDGLLRLLFTGNLESNYNKLNIFIDSKTGGQNTIGPDNSSGGVNPDNNDGIFDKYSGSGSSDPASIGFTFDAGFEADYVMIARNGSSPGNTFDFNFLSIGDASISEVSIGIFGVNTQGSNASVGASAIGIAFDNANTAGISGGTNAANTAAALAVQTGIEFWIPLAAIGNPGVGDMIKVSAHVNGSAHDFLSNQSLGGFAPPQGNLGGDGNGNFTADVSQINLNSFTGDQFFTIVVAHDNDGDGVLSHVDNCPDFYNPGQEDFDMDGIGDVCDSSCSPGLDLNHNFSNGDVFNFATSGLITYTGNIPAGAEISFDATLGVELNIGTSIDQGALFTMLTVGCVP